MKSSSEKTFTKRYSWHYQFHLCCKLCWTQLDCVLGEDGNGAFESNFHWTTQADCNLHSGNLGRVAKMDWHWRCFFLSEKHDVMLQILEGPVIILTLAFSCHQMLIPRGNMRGLALWVFFITNITNWDIFTLVQQCWPVLGSLYYCQSAHSISIP